MNLIERIKAKARAAKKRIVLPKGDEPSSTEFASNCA